MIMRKSKLELNCRICSSKTHDLYECYRSDGIAGRTKTQNKTVTTYASVIKLEGAVCSACRRKNWREDLKSLLVFAAIEAVTVVIMLLYGKNPNVMGIGFIVAITIFFAMFPSVLHLIFGRDGSEILIAQKKKEWPGVYFTPAEAAKLTKIR